jgi:hypothetical protein
MEGVGLSIVTTIVTTLYGSRTFCRFYRRVTLVAECGRTRRASSTQTTFSFFTPTPLNRKGRWRCLLLEHYSSILAVGSARLPVARRPAQQLAHAQRSSAGLGVSAVATAQRKARSARLLVALTAVAVTPGRELLGRRLVGLTCVAATHGRERFARLHVGLTLVAATPGRERSAPLHVGPTPVGATRGRVAFGRPHVGPIPVGAIPTCSMPCLSRSSGFQ